MQVFEKKNKLSNLLESKELQSKISKSTSNTQPQEIQEMESFVWDNLTWKLIRKDDPVVKNEDSVVENGKFTIINTLYVQWTGVS